MSEERSTTEAIDRQALEISDHFIARYYGLPAKRGQLVYAIQSAESFLDYMEELYPKRKDKMVKKTIEYLIDNIGSAVERDWVAVPFVTLLARRYRSRFQGDTEYALKLSKIEGVFERYKELRNTK